MLFYPEPLSKEKIQKGYRIKAKLSELLRVSSSAFNPMSSLQN
jgi:hypothetical protein